MERPIKHDPIFLAQPSADATMEDIPAADDLMDTLKANADRCVGMAANMIGIPRRIIVFADGQEYREMFNPEILKKTGPFETEEGCLSLTGRRKTTRYRTVKVQWKTREGQTRIKTFTGWTAQIIQHEIDHCNGILI
ncbi:MAG: peptide deformylase [Faecousia sp.]